MTDNTNKDAPLQAADPEEYSQRRRLKRIHDARERVIEKRWDAVRGLHSGELTEYGAKSLIRYAVEDYIMEAERPLKNLSDSHGDGTDKEDYWKEIDLGTQTHEVLGDLESFHGLRSVLVAPDPLQYTYETEERGLDRRIQTTPKTVSTQIDPDILMQAYRTVNRALGEYGLDIDLKEGMDVMAFSEVPLNVEDDQEYVRIVAGDNATIAEENGDVEVEAE